MERFWHFFKYLGSHLNLRSPLGRYVVAACAILVVAVPSILAWRHNASVASDLSSNATPILNNGQAENVMTDDEAAAPAAAVDPLAGLALIPWEGGPAYYKQFPVTDAAGWDEPTFFPVGIFYNGISSSAEAAFDKSYGINSYVGMNGDLARYEYFRDNGMFWLGTTKLNNTFPDSGPHWPGKFLDDEPDGRFGSAANDLSYVRQLLTQYPEDGRFRIFNFTQIVAGNYGSSNNSAYTEMINSYRGPISADVYWYTIPHCGPGNPAYDYMIHKVSDPAHCRTASSYGKLIASLRERDAADGTLQPIWQFIENLNGGPGEGPFHANISPGQIKGAAMNSIINEARGLLWFNTSLTGPCQAGSALRQAQVNQGFCGNAQMSAMRDVNNLVHSLAPIINTQSYQHEFGPRLDTMLKWHDGSAYVFAMINGDADSVPGARSFSLPQGFAHTSKVEVVNENRTIPVTAGKFTDTFDAEYSYHIYKITP